MAFNAGAIVAHMRLNASQFHSELQKTQVATKKSDRIIGGILKGGAIAVGATFLANQIGNITRRIVSFGQGAAQLKDMGSAFENMAEQAGTSSDEVIAGVRGITKSLSNRQITQAGNTLELLGVGMASLPRFTEIARAAAVGLGRDVGFMLESLSTGTARQSRLWLDNLGIIISVEDANKKYAKQLGITTSEMTDQQNRAAFLNEVLIRGGDIIDKVGASNESASEKAGSLTASWQNLTDKITLFTIEVLKLPDIFKSIADLLDRIATTNERLQKTPPESGGGFFSGAGGVGGSIPRSPQLDAARNRIALEQGKLDATFAKLADIALGGVSGAGSQRAAAEAARIAADAAAARAIETSKAVDKRLEDAKREQGFPDFVPGAPLPTGPHGFRSIDQTTFDVPKMEMDAPEFGDDIARQVDIGQMALNTLGDSFSAMFEFLVVESDDAGRAFAANMLNGISGLASALGDLYIQTGIGMFAIGQLNPFVAIAAGIALKAISGLMRGAAIKNAPTPQSQPRTLRNVTEDEMAQKNDITFIVQGDFMGDKVWIDKLAEKLRTASRNRGVTVIHEAA